MKIIAFNGCLAPYTKNGMKIIPISKNPSDSDIKSVVDVASTGKVLGHGMNGRTFLWGEDLVVKKYTKEDGAKREIAALDGMYDRGISIPRLQQGLFAFSTQNNDTYLVSTRINGQNPNNTTNKYNHENLKSLMDVICELDKPRLLKEKINKYDYPYQLPMHYDLHDGNINITNSEGGIFDLEYLIYEKLFSRIEDGKLKYVGCDCNLSDIPTICSNLRSFESRALLPYLMSIDEQEADKIFSDYLHIKSDYHRKRSEFFKAEAEKFKNINPKTARVNEYLAERELAHAEVLKKPSKEVVSAEKIKIQISNSIFTQSKFERMDSMKFNPEQLKKYVKDTVDFFSKMEKKKQPKHTKLYWNDCSELMKSWSEVIQWLEWQSKEPTFEMFNYKNTPQYEMSYEEMQEITRKMIEHKKDRELFLKKQTTTTLPLFAQVPEV